MKESKMSVNEQVFHALIFAHSKLGEFEAADNIKDIMNDIGLGVDHSTYTAKMRGMIASGVDIDTIKIELKKYNEEGTFFDDLDYFTLITEFCEKGNGEAAKLLAGELPRKVGFFQSMRNSLPSMIFNGQNELALEILNTFETTTKTGQDQDKMGNSDHGLFFLRIMANANSSPQKILETLEQLNKPKEHTLRLISRMIELYIRDEKFEDGAEFIKLALQKYDRHFLFDVMFGSAMAHDVRRNITTLEEITDLMINISRMGVPMTTKLLSRGFIGHIVRRIGDGSVIPKITYVVNKVVDESAPINLSALIGSFMLETLNTNKPENFKQAAAITAIHDIGARFSNSWKNSLSNNYIIFNDIESLLTVIIFTSPLSMWIQGSDFTDSPNENIKSSRIKERENIFKVLELIHQNGASMEENADQVLDKVLTKMEQMKLGFPSHTATGLSTIVKDENVLERIKVLENNYNTIQEIWPNPEEGKKFILDLRKPYLRSSFKSKRVQKSLPTELSELERMMTNQIKNGRADFKGAVKLVEMYANKGELDKLRDFMEQLNGIEGFDKFEVPTQQLNIAVSKFLEKETNVDEFLQFPFEKFRRQSPEFYLRSFINSVLKFLRNDKYHEAIQMLNYIEKNPEYFKEDIHKDLFSTFLFDAARIVKDEETFDTITARVKAAAKPIGQEIGDDLSGLKVFNRVEQKDLVGALAIFKVNAEEHKHLRFLGNLCKEIIQMEEKALFDELLDICTKSKGEEAVLYDFARIFLEMGKTPQAKKLFQAPGLRYIPSMVEPVCRRLTKENKPGALKDFVYLCKNLTFADLPYLYDALINGLSHDPDQIQEIWMEMQEDAYMPSENQLIKMSEALKKHNYHVPFDVPDRPNPLAEKTDSPIPKKGTKKFWASNFDEWIQGLTIPQAIEILKEKAKEKSLLKSHLINTVDLMREKNDFSQLQEIYNIVAKHRDIKVKYEVFRRIELEQILKLEFKERDTFIVHKAFDSMKDFAAFDDSLLPHLGAGWITIIRKHGRAAKKLLEKSKEMNDSKFSTDLFFSYILTGNQKLANEILTTHSFEEENLNLWMKRLDDNDARKILQFANTNNTSSSESIELLRTKIEKLHEQVKN